MRITYLFGIFLILATGVVLFLSYVSPLKKPSFFTFDTSSPNAKLYFLNDTLFPDQKNSITTEIMLSSTVPVSEVQIDVSYDPNVITNFSFSPSQNNFFGNTTHFEVTLNEVRHEIGRATFAIKLLPFVSEKKGEAAIAHISFQINPYARGNTKIEFLNKSTVMTREERESILSGTVPLSVFFKNTNMPTIQPTQVPETSDR